MILVLSVSSPEFNFWTSPASLNYWQKILKWQAGVLRRKTDIQESVFKPLWFAGEAWGMLLIVRWSHDRRNWQELIIMSQSGLIANNECNTDWYQQGGIRHHRELEQQWQSQTQTQTHKKQMYGDCFFKYCLTACKLSHMGMPAPCPMLILPDLSDGRYVNMPS